MQGIVTQLAVNQASNWSAPVLFLREILVKNFRLTSNPASATSVLAQVDSG